MSEFKERRCVVKKVKVSREEGRPALLPGRIPGVVPAYHPGPRKLTRIVPPQGAVLVKWTPGGAEVVGFAG